MKESVAKAKHPWLVGICIGAIALGYFYLLANNRHPEPGPNLLYDTEQFRDVDKVDTRFEETGRIVPTVEAPKALAVGADGKLYVTGKDAVQVLDEDGNELDRFIVDAPPTCIGLAPEGDILLGIRNRILVIDATDAARTEWPALDSRAYITSIAANDTDVYVADAGNRVVLRFGRDGILKNRIGETDPSRDVPGLLVPSPYLDLAFDRDGTLWVSNPGRLGLESYREDGDLITSWYRPTLKLDGFSGCCNPSHIAFRADGKLITCEKGLVRIKVYESTSGEFEELIAGSGLFPREQAVRDLAVDSRDRILVLDPRYNAIRVFEEKEDSDVGTDQQA